MENSFLNSSEGPRPARQAFLKTIMNSAIDNKILSKVKKIVRERLKHEFSGHDYWHCYRVAQTALTIGKKEKANVYILELAAWLHDIAIIEDKKFHEVKGALFAKELLMKLDVDKDIVEKVARCIRKHRFSKRIQADTLEEKILQDADKLDALGALGLARLFTLAGKYGQILHDPHIKPNFEYYLKYGRSNTTINHFYDKLFKLKNLLHTRTAKIIAFERETYMKEYIRRFYLEWEGKK